jgi:hypothetical protein
MRLRCLLIVAALATPVAACAGNRPASPRLELTVVTISADPDGDGPDRERSARLRCRRTDARSVCNLLRSLPRAAFEPVPAEVSCAQIFGGPHTGRIRGVVRGRRVLAGYDRTDSCEIDRYDRVAPVLRLALRADSP